jgi:Uma2 family endonuclease
MSRRSSAAPFQTVADLFERLGDVPAQRIRLDPRPGTATERDLIRANRAGDRLYELVDGILVEKVMGFPESTLTCDLIKLLGYYLDQHPRGFLAGPDGAVRLMPGLVRIPDISFVSWDQLPKRERPREPVAGLAPALAVEVLSEGNTPREMQRKVRDYFLAGVRVVWFVDPMRRTVQVLSAPDESVTLTESDTVEGGDLLPGLALSVRKIFAEVPPPAAKPAPGKPGSPKPRKGRLKG